MENLIYNDHYKILQEAMMKNRDPEIKIVCGDGVFVVNSARFKLASSFWMKLLWTIPESNSYVLIAPDISVLSISHIGKYYDNRLVPPRTRSETYLLNLIRFKGCNPHIGDCLILDVWRGIVGEVSLQAPGWNSVCCEDVRPCF